MEEVEDLRSFEFRKSHSASSNIYLYVKPDRAESEKIIIIINIADAEEEEEESLNASLFSFFGEFIRAPCDAKRINLIITSGFS